MAYTYHNSKADGTPDQVIVSGQIGALFTTLTSQERISGDQEFSKMWITSDIDVTVYVGILSPTKYTSTVFVSALDTDAVGDLTGSETRYGAMEVVSALETGIVVKNTFYTLVRVSDTIIVDGKAYEVSTITDNGDGTSTIVATIDYHPLPPLPPYAWYITSVLQINLVTATPKPFWREEKVDAGALWYGEYATAELLIAD